MISAIHQSSLGTMLRCGEQFRRRYIMGEIIPPGVAMGRGTAVHKANEVNLKSKIRTGEDIPLGDMKDAARDGFVAAFRNGVYLTKEDQPSKSRILNDALNESLALTECYAEKVAPSIMPTNTERTFLIDIGLDLPLSGRIDAEQENGRKIDDLKTSTNKWPEGRILKEIQPVFYSFAVERETGARPTFTYHILRNLKGGPESQVQSMTSTDQNYSALMYRIKVFLDSLRSGVFIPADPSNWICDPKWCGYWNTCNALGNGRKTWI